MTKYSLTPEHRAQLRPWADRWIRIAMRTEPQTEADRAAMIDAINGLYDAAKLPRPEHIVFVPSPLVGRVASGFAAAIWHMRDKGRPAATGDATEAATEAATWAATRAATEAATWDATEAATEAATWAATRAATRAATWDATEAATWDAPTKGWARALAARIAPNAVELLVSCANAAMSMYAGGNMWAGYSAFLSFFRHVAKLPLDYSKWQHFETASELGGFRWMHPKFCIVSDFPTVLRVDEARRPHCDDGPSHEWADGWKLYHWHGLRIDDEHSWIITDKARITPDLIDAEPNAERRRVMLEVMGYERYVAERKARVVAEDTNHGQPRRLLEMSVRGETIRVLDVLNGSLEPDGSRRRFFLGALDGRTPHECVAASYGINPARYREAVRT